MHDDRWMPDGEKFAARPHELREHGVERPAMECFSCLRVIPDGEFFWSLDLTSGATKGFEILVRSSDGMVAVCAACVGDRRDRVEIVLQLIGFMLLTNFPPVASTVEPPSPGGTADNGSHRPPR